MMAALATPDPAPRAERWFAACLEHLEGRLTEAGSGRWRFAGRDEAKARTTVAFYGDWLEVERPLPGCRVTRLPRTARWTSRVLNAEFPLSPGARAVLPVGESEARIRAELPLNPTGDDPAQVARWIAACTAAAPSVHGAGTSANVTDPVEPCLSVETDLREQCEQAGWPPTAHSTPGQTVIPLPARGDSVCHATATTEAGAVRFHVPLEITGNGGPNCQTAVNITLLRVAGAVRLVQSTATHTEGRITAALQVRLQPPIASEMVNHALSALALAHQQIAAEVDALAGDDALASAYLALQGAR